jgi:hypothetical protein
MQRKDLTNRCFSLYAVPSRPSLQNQGFLASVTAHNPLNYMYIKYVRMSEGHYWPVAIT